MGIQFLSPFEAWCSRPRPAIRVAHSPGAVVHFGRDRFSKALPKSEDPHTLQRIQEHLDALQAYRNSGKDQFFHNPFVRNAILHHWEQLGNQFQLLSSDFHRQHPGLPVERLKAIRNRIAHDHDQVDLNTIWELTKSLAPALHRWLNAPSPQRWSGPNIKIPKAPPPAARPDALTALIKTHGQEALRLKREFRNLKEFSAPEFEQTRAVLAHTLVVLGTAAYDLSQMEPYTHSSRAQGALRNLAKIQHAIAHPEEHPDAQTPDWLWAQLQRLPKFLKAFQRQCMQTSAPQSVMAPIGMPALATS
jgi:uncharacterized protein with HEPN domain